MEHLQLITGGIIVLSGLGLMAGLHQPWVVLWWRPFQNRLMVLRTYGLVFLFSLLMRYVIL